MSNPNSDVYASYNMPSREPLNVGPTGQSLPEMQSSIHLEKMVNAGSKYWKPNLFNPITFPLNHGIQVADQTQSKLPIVLPQSNTLNTFMNVKPVPPRLGETSSAAQMTNLKQSHPSSSWSVSSSLQSRQPVTHGSDKTVSSVHYQTPDKGSSQSKMTIGKSQSPDFEGASNYNIGSSQMQPKPAYVHSQSSLPALNSRTEDLLRRGETSNAINRIASKPGQSSALSVVSPSLQSKQPVTSVSDKTVPPVKYLKISSSRGKIGSSPLFERASNYNAGSSHAVAQMQPKPVDSQSNLQDYTSRELIPPSQRGTSHPIQKPLQPSHISMIPPRYQSKMPVTSGSDRPVPPVKYQKLSSSQSGIGSGNYSTDTGSNLLVGLTQKKQSFVLAQSKPLDVPTNHGSFIQSLSGTDSGSKITDFKPDHSSNSWSMASSIPFEKPLVFRSDPAESLSNYQRLHTGSSQSRTNTGKSSTPLFDGALNYNTDAGTSYMVDPKWNKPNLIEPHSGTQDTYANKLVSPSLDQSPSKHYIPSLFSQSPPVAPSHLEVRLPLSGGPEAVILPNNQKFQYGSNPSRGGSVEIPNLLAGHGFSNSGNRGALSALDPKPMPAELPQKYASLEPGSWYGQNNDIHGSPKADLLPQKPPKKTSLPESQSYSQSDFIAGGPSTAFASPMWDTTFQSTGAQTSKDWMFPISGVLDSWNLEFPQVNYQPQNSVAKIKKDPLNVSNQQPSAVPGKKRIIHSKNGYKRERLALSKAAYDPKYKIPPAKDTMAMNTFKMQPKYPQSAFKV